MAIEITVNGEPMAVDDDTDVAALAKRLDIEEQRGVAIAVNQTVVERGRWNACRLSDRDQVLVITAARGG